MGAFGGYGDLVSEGPNGIGFGFGTVSSHLVLTN